MSELEQSVPVDSTTGGIEGNVVLLQGVWQDNAEYAEELEKIERERYIEEVVVDAMTEAGVDVTSPGFHNARFSATNAVRRVLNDVREDEIEVGALIREQEEK